MAAVDAGADALGFVFYEPSPRHVSVDRAAAIARGLPPFVTTVALFVNADAQTIAQVVDEVGVDLLQFHGQECPDYCAQHRRPWIRAVRMKPDTDLLAAQAEFGAGRGLLLDAYRPGVPGGTGETFDWARIPPDLASRIVLGGGLKPDNVAQAVRAVRPFAVDVSGGVEAEPRASRIRKRSRLLSRRCDVQNTEMRLIDLPDEHGHFGPYGGIFVAETLMEPLDELRLAYEKYMAGSGVPGRAGRRSASTTSAARRRSITPSA